MSKKKTTQLKNMEISSVDLVRRGANQDADICLFKSADDDDLPLKDDRSILRQMFDLLKSAFTADDEPEDIEKDATSFNSIQGKRESKEKLWQYSDALRESIFSILNDDDLEADTKKQQLNTSLEQYSQAMKTLFDDLVGTSATMTVVTTKSEGKGETTPVEDPTTEENPINKGELEMNYDPSKLSAEDRAVFDELVKKCATEEPTTETTPAAAPPATEPAATEPTVAKSDDVTANALKALQDEVAQLRKSAEINSFAEIAKKYEIIGKKPEELAETLYALKKSGEETYNTFIAVLDEQVDLVNKSGLFTEVGKSVHGPVSQGADNALSQIETIAKSYIEKDPSLDYASAKMKAWDNNPQLRAEYESTI